MFDAIGFDNSFNFEEWKRSFKFEIKSLTEEEIVFDLIGVDAPIANALRRILLSEVPTMAIETVFIANNTSIIPDEVLAHRIGLIPILADPREFEYRTPDIGTPSSSTFPTYCYCRSGLPREIHSLTDLPSLFPAC